MILTGKELLETENLIDVITDGLRKSEMQNYDGRIHASSSGYCPRRGALEATYKGMRSYEATSALYFKLGIALEDVILDSLDNKKRLLFRQYHLPEIGINLGGKVDGIVIHNGKLHCLEIKSCGTLPSKPDIEHLSQINIYSSVTGLPGLLLYASRSVQDHRGELKLKLFDLGFSVDMSRSLRNSTIAYFCSKPSNLLLPEIPDYITSEKDCGYCPFKHICWNGELDKSTLVPMTESENADINRAADSFLETFMSIPEIIKRRNGVLKFLSEHGNKTAKNTLQPDEDWQTWLLEY